MSRFEPRPDSKPHEHEAPHDSPQLITGSLLARNTLLSLLIQAAPLLVAIVAIPVLLDRLGIARFGVLSLAWVVLGYAAAFDLGVARASTKRTAELLAAGEATHLAAVASAVLSVNFTLGVLGGAILAGATPFLVGAVLQVPDDLVVETTHALWVVAAGVPIILTLSAARSLLEGAQRFDLISLVSVPSAVLTYLLPAIGSSQGLPLWSLLAMIVAARVLAAGAYVLLWGRALPQIQRLALPEGAVAWSLLRFGGWLTLSNVVSPVVLYGERAIVASTLTIRGLGLYVIPYELVARIAVVPGAFYTALFPAFSTLSAGFPQILRQTYRRSLTYLLLILGPFIVLLVTLSGDILRVWLGAEIAESSTAALQVFAVGALLNSLGYVPLAFLQASGRPDLPAKVQAAEILPTYLLTWALASNVGLVGAVTAWLCRMTLDTALLFGLAARQSKEVELSSLRRIGGGLVLTIAAATLGASLAPVSPTGLRVGAIVLLLGGLVSALWRLGMTASDRAALARQVRVYVHGLGRKQAHPDS